jgi:hypothetical protein
MEITPYPIAYEDYGCVCKQKGYHRTPLVFANLNSSFVINAAPLLLKIVDAFKNQQNIELFCKI